jgi:hypothetical protein
MEKLDEFCAGCYKLERLEAAPFKKCGRCNISLYCGVECQRSHWASHKQVCNHYRSATAPDCERFDSGQFNQWLASRQGALGLLYMHLARTADQCGKFFLVAHIHACNDPAMDGYCIAAHEFVPMSAISALPSSIADTLRGVGQDQSDAHLPTPVVVCLKLTAELKCPFAIAQCIHAHVFILVNDKPIELMYQIVNDSRTNRYGKTRARLGSLIMHLQRLVMQARAKLRLIK